MSASKQRFGVGDLEEVFSNTRKVIVAKGKKQIDFDLGETPADSPDFVRAVLGPSGNLRAPTLLIGKTALVGFSEPAWVEVFG